MVTIRACRAISLLRRDGVSRCLVGRRCVRERIGNGQVTRDQLIDRARTGKDPTLVFQSDGRQRRSLVRVAPKISFAMMALVSSSAENKVICRVGFASP